MSGEPQFRIIDTGLRTGRENIAFDQAMIEAHQAGEIPDTLRFIHFKPVALVGRHQATRQEIRVDFCRDNGVEVGRRITGGGAIYLDENQMGWALVCRRGALGGGSLADMTRSICEAAAAGLSSLGMKAQYRPRNDIEVAGRKISGTGGFFDGDTLIYQGTVIGDLNPDIMFGALNVPKEKLEKRALDAAALRVTSLREELETRPSWTEVAEALAQGFRDHLGIAAEWGDVSPQEEARARAVYDEEIGTDDFVYEIDDPAREPGVKTGVHVGAGGTVRAHIRLEGPQSDRIREVLITGDFFVTPPRVVLDLEAALRSAPLVSVRERVRDYFASADIGLLTIAPEDFAAAIENAAALAPQ